jgi:uncharacterized protein (TIGR03437 family)
LKWSRQTPLETGPASGTSEKKMNFRSLAALSLFSLASAYSQTVTGPVVQFNTNMGNINVTLRPDVAPNTVANFLSYVNDGSYTNIIIERSVPGFVVQGGGWQLISGTPTAITANAPVNNECPLLANGVPNCGLSNVAGTLAMAKASGEPNSATNEWYFNVENNGGSPNNLDFVNGGYTVFGQLTDAASQTVLNQINALLTCNESGTIAAFAALPVINFPSCSGTISASNYVVVNYIGQIQALPTIAANGIVTASSFGDYLGVAAPGSYVEIYGTFLAGTTRGWAASDFNGTKAPTTLDNVSVTLNGVPAYVNYVSPTQVNIQVPDNIPTGPVSVVVNFGGVTGSPGSLLINALEPGLLAPASFNVGGKQYVAAFHSSNNTPVSSGNIPGVAAAPAKSGETLIFYGTGFGPINNGVVAGQIASGQSTLMNPFTMTIGGAPATIAYAGLTPGLVGVYQFNVVVPSGLTNGDLLIQTTLNGFFGLQTKLYLSVSN